MTNNKIEAGSTQEKATGLAWAFTPDPQLPNVLILGDSISIGYTLKVRKLLSNTANVYRPLDNGNKNPANCADTGTGVKCLPKWLGANHWDVIHFNFGLHDVKYLDEAGKYVTPDKGKQVTLPDVYEKNLRQLVGELKKTGARLVWCSTTPIPEGASGRVKGDEVAYNAIAEKVMKENGVPIDDLYSLMASRCAELQKPRDVHFTEEGSDVEATAVADIVKQHLKNQ
jgi:acyl-CoA thioesterase-1